MNCCGHKHNDKQHKHPGGGHLRMMVLCCGLPVLILFVLPLISGSFPGVSLFLGSVAPFLCLTMMIGMMFFFMNRSGRKDNACHDIKEIKQ